MEIQTGEDIDVEDKIVCGGLKRKERQAADHAAAQDSKVILSDLCFEAWSGLPFEDGGGALTYGIFRFFLQ